MSITAYPTIMPAGTWSVDLAGSRVAFAVKHSGVATVRGELHDFEGALRVDERPNIASARGTVWLESVDTGEPKRDEHLLSPDFFDVAHNPEVTFESTEIETLGAQSLRITGDLTMHGVTNEVILDAIVGGVVVDPTGDEHVSLQVTGSLSRSDYGLKFMRALRSGNALVADRIELRLTVSMVKYA